jgi:cytoskeletal protein RodZ
MAKGTFGERLKRERELREVTLEEVSTATRISARFLEALENEDWSRLPGGVFGRGFVRSIARYLGLNEESLLAEYDLARGENASLAPPRPEERIPSPPKWIPIAIVLAILLLLVGLIVGGIYGWRKFKAHRLAKKASNYLLLPASPFVPVAPAAESTALLLELNVNNIAPLTASNSSGKMVLTAKDPKAGMRWSLSPLKS